MTKAPCFILRMEIAYKKDSKYNGLDVKINLKIGWIIGAH